MSRFTLGLGILVGWVLIWGSASPGTILGGIIVIVLMFWTFPTSRRWKPSIRIDLVAAAKLAAYFTRQIIASNVRLSLVLLRPNPKLRAVVVDMPMHTSSPSIITAVTNFAAMSPGLMVVGTSLNPPVIRAHVLVFGTQESPEAALESIYRLEELAVQGFGSQEDRAAYRASQEASS